jgi:pilus assembly protein CpaB
MSPRRIVFLLIAFVASGLTIVLGRAWLASQRPAPVEPTQIVVAAPEKPVTMILVARGDLKVGQFVRPENLRWQAWPDEGVSDSYLVEARNKTTQDPTGMKRFLGAVVRSGINDGEPITLSRIIPPGDGGFLAAVLKPGYRAITVSVSAVSGVSGLVFPGDRIDLIATMTLTDPTGKDKVDHHASETILSNLKVLALDQRLDDQAKEAKDAQIARTATLEVTPKQAEIISVINEVSRLSMSLRSLPLDGPPEDEVASNTTEPTFTYDSDASRLILPRGAVGGGHHVVVVRGANQSEVEFTGANTSGGGSPPPPKSGNDEDH